MSIADLYTSGEHQRNIGHLASIIKLALADGVINENEQELLENISMTYDITNEEVKQILKNPDNYPINPPTSYDKRIERLHNLALMVFANGDVSDAQVSILRRVTIGLGFHLDTIDEVIEEAVSLVIEDSSLEHFTIEIKAINKK